MTDFTEVHRQADILARKRLKNKKYYKEVLDAVVLKAAHTLAYWDVLAEMDKAAQAAKPVETPTVSDCICKKVKALFK